jgi:enterochelin esterase family protein
LAIFLDGELYREKVDVLSVLDELEASASIANTFFAFVSVSTWEARWTECPCNPLFARFISEELLPWLTEHNPFLKAAPERVLIGLSYTGIAAAYTAFQSPVSFTRVIAQSGSFWSNDCWLVEQFRLREKPLSTAFYLDVGSQETEENVRHK